MCGALLFCAGQWNRGDVAQLQANVSVLSMFKEDQAKP